MRLLRKETSSSKGLLKIIKTQGNTRKKGGGQEIIKMAKDHSTQNPLETGFFLQGSNYIFQGREKAPFLRLNFIELKLFLLCFTRQSKAISDRKWRKGGGLEEEEALQLLGRRIKKFVQSNYLVIYRIPILLIRKNELFSLQHQVIRAKFQSCHLRSTFPITHSN